MTKFQVFLSHNSRDKPTVRELARLLEGRDIRVWLDEEQLIPGRNWQPLLEKGIERSATGAVLVGKDGVGPWANEEMQALLRQAVDSGKPVIPVLLPTAPQKPKLPLFLSNRTWVDLRDGYTEAGIALLIWGITGKKPDSLTADVAALCCTEGILVPLHETAESPASAEPPQATLGRIRDLLVDLPGWDRARRRRSFVAGALGKRHRVMGEVEWEGGGRQLAWDVPSACEDYPEPTASGLSPLCALLTAIPAEFGPHPDRDRELAALRALLQCPIPDRHKD